MQFRVRVLAGLKVQQLEEAVCGQRKETNKMNHPFDELAKGLARSVTRRGALKKFSVGLACFGLANKVGAATHAGYCVANPTSLDGTAFLLNGYCLDTTTCRQMASSQCKGPLKPKNVGRNSCDSSGWTVIATNKPCSF
ncbi:MAG TPA: hypothetical protein PLX89_20610 [Verrucomicrobiota bacterium]|nr:hypothetical protein [Verrucomicrobiales bacterium]HRI15405.1 hypothetical protein [Verrucomicrobiota bacterium]